MFCQKEELFLFVFNLLAKLVNNKKGVSKMDRVRIARRLMKLAEELMKRESIHKKAGDVLRLVFANPDEYGSYELFEVDEDIVLDICERENVDFYLSPDWDISEALTKHIDELRQKARKISYVDFVIISE